MSKTMQLRSLYEQDILLWVEETIAQLRNRDFENLDLEHLIEEVESLGISQKKELISRLIVLLEHLLKRLYVKSPYDYNGWERTIRTQRNELEVLMEQVPSLKILWDQSFDKAWKIALKTVCEEYNKIDFPPQWLYSRQVEAMLNEKFWN
ncbi:MAG: DUF29 domain-containing protein [Prochlorotrichaceae cyanobacterium]|jgi:hypothetical protein